MNDFPLPTDPKVVILPIRIAGPKSTRYVRVVLDTGATYTMICPDALEEVGCDLSRPIRDMTITTASRIERAPFFMISAIEILNHRLEDIEVASHRLPEKVPADGLLGLNALKHFDVHLEFLKKTLRLIRGS